MIFDSTLMVVICLLLLGFRRESIDTAHHQLVTNKLRIILADERHPEFHNSQTDATDLGFAIVRLYDTYSNTFQWPFRHTISKQADKHVLSLDRDLALLGF